MSFKKCFKCGIEKDLSEFYAHKKMADGHLNKCKDCTKKDAKNHRDENIEKIREYDRNRPNHKERVKNNNLRLKELKTTNPEKYKQYTSITKSLNNKYRKEHGNASCKVKRAVEKGILIKPTHCENCNEEKDLQGHHRDYSKPLDVIWLCVKCHNAEHRRLNEESRQQKES